MVLDFTRDFARDDNSSQAWSVGRYNEERVNMYNHDLFAGGRNIHMGIDIGAPAKTEVFSFYEGVIFALADNPLPGDYGPTLVTEHNFNGVSLFALYGHLTRASLLGKAKGQHVYKGELLGFVGEPQENGGWNPHVHFQLSYIRPTAADLPGVVCKDDLALALKTYPDPQLVLGRLY